MRILLLTLFFFTLVSCEQTETETPPQKLVSSESPVTVPDDTVQVRHMEGDTTKVLLMGRGSEPGWICEFYQTKVRFVYDHGKDSIILRGLDFSNQMRMEKGFELFKLESLTKDT